ncbi:MG2 domain-containing protein [Mucilaginibacter sp. P25]|uniref:MG2 domain-containing protein n=1 Tax=Mucilaginibacter sp. P25 TaxID=3423945 RepID=UPI003D7A9BA5
MQVTHQQNEEINEDLFNFSPAIKGKAIWTDARTIEFRPDEKLDPGKNYTADFKLSKLIEVSDHFEHFKFNFQVIQPYFTVSFIGMQTASSTSNTEMKLTGDIQTADAEDPSAVDKLIVPNYDSPVKINWEHDAAHKNHHFTITGLTRIAGKANPLTINWDGSSIGVDKKGNQNFEVPAIGDFKVLNIRAVQDNDQYVEVQFSDNILVGQELNGLISINNITDPAYSIDGSLVKVYAPDRLQGDYTISVNEGIKNTLLKRITKGYTANLFFENRLPAVAIPGKGVILPDSGRIMMPFEAINLNAVDVIIIKIYENNVPQYFQSNGFDGSAELRQVGKPIVQKTIRLDTDKGLNLHKKNRFMLDLDQMIRTEPGAIYRVVIGFRRSYSLFNCKVYSGKVQKDNGDDEEGGYYGGDYSDNASKVSDEDDDFWKRYDNYYPEGYNWQERDDACTDSYYSKQRWATRNIISSNIGLIAKRGNDNSMLIAVTDILSAEPMSNVDLELLDYQKQVIYKTTTDGDGLAKLNLKRKPYLLVAKKGVQRGYLKLDDGSSLPLSRFNVGGEEVQNGLKGFIYGERGVWRPGDSIYTSFILEDKLKTLPADHPVEFELYDPSDKLYRRITQTKSLDGFYSFHTATETSSPTGNWTAKVKVGGARFEKKSRLKPSCLTGLSLVCRSAGHPN